MLTRAATAEMLRTLMEQARDDLMAVEIDLDDFEENEDCNLYEAEERLEQVGKIAAACAAICVVAH